MIAIDQFTISKIYDGEKGDDGVSVIKVVPEYTVSTSASSLPSNPDWSETKPLNIDETHYLWTRMRSDFSDNSHTYSDAICDVTISGIISDVNKNTKSITDKVWESDITTKINQYDGSTVNTIRDRVTKTETNIDGITSRVSDVESKTDDLGTRMTSAESNITQNANKISAMVTVNGQTSSITLTENMVKAITDQFIIKGSDNSTTVISGGKIHTNSIKTNDLATDAIKSTNYKAGSSDSPYSTFGTFLDLTNGNFYTPNFGIQSTGSTGAFINGEIIATSGRIGDDVNTAWDIGTFTDYEANEHGSIIGHGDAFIQSGKWMISGDKIDTRWYDNNLKLTYIYDPKDSTYYDYGMSVPIRNTTDSDYISPEVSENFLYIRNHASTIPSIETDWNYIFRVDKNGMIWINGQSLDQKYAAITDVGSVYLPKTGGTITGDLTVNGTLNATATKANQLVRSLIINGKSFDGSAAVDVGTIGAAYGGTGKTSLVDSANVLLNALTTGSDTPSDNDYYISQYANGGTSYTTYHRRPMYKMWTWIKSKLTNDHSNLDSLYVLKSGDTISGSLTVENGITSDVGNFGDLIVNGVGRFTNGLYGNLTGDVSGNASTASKLNSNRDFTIGKTKKSVDWSSAVSFTQAEISDNASTSAAGWMSKDDKIKLNGIEAGAQVNTITGIKGGSETSYRTGNVNITATNIGLGNLTNNKQIKGLSSGTTSGHLVIWGADGYTVSDSGIEKESVTTKLTLSGTDYSVSSNAIIVTKANLQSAIQDTNLVLMTAAERSKLSSIQVSEGGTIDFSGVTASAPITATVATDKTVNITHNTSGVAAGTYKSVTVNTYGHVTGGTNPTTLSGYGITDAKIVSGVITLGSNTITPLTATSTLDATKLNGTASISTTGNAATATKFASNQSITLTGDTIGTASSQAGWSIATNTMSLSGANNRLTTANINYHDNKLRYYLATSNMTTGKPSNDAHIIHMPWDNTGWDVQLAVTHDPHIQIRSEDGQGNWGNWLTVLGSNNYTDYTVTKTGSGASGTWNINISGTATKATQDGDGNTISSTYAKLSGATFTGAVNGTYYTSSSKMTISSGKIAEITNPVPKGGLFADGAVFANPGTRNDMGWIRVLGTAEADTVLEIATGDDGGSGEQIVARQYNTSSAIVHEMKLLDKSGNTSIPGNFIIATGVTLQYNTTTASLDFIFN